MATRTSSTGDDRQRQSDAGDGHANEDRNVESENADRLGEAHAGEHPGAVQVADGSGDDVAAVDAVVVAERQPLELPVEIEAHASGDTGFVDAHRHAAEEEAAAPHDDEPGREPYQRRETLAVARPDALVDDASDDLGNQHFHGDCHAPHSQPQQHPSPVRPHVFENADQRPYA